MLPKIINPDQSGYVKGRYIGANVRIALRERKKNTVFIVEVRLAIQASLQALHLNAKKQIIQINLTW